MKDADINMATINRGNNDREIFVLVIVMMTFVMIMETTVVTIIIVT